MHPTKLPQRVIDQALERRRALHPLADFDPIRCALLVVDMQDFFIDMVPSARAIVANINRLAKEIRLGGGRIVWIKMTVDETDATTWSHFYSKLLSQRDTDAHFNRLKRGADDWEIWHELNIRDEDWQIEKSRFSAFIQGSSDLEARLRGQGIDTVLVTGTVTNVCCESTARDAMMLNFETIIVSDACAALDDESHVATLNNFQTIFGDVLSVDEILAGIERTIQLSRASI
jgi:ureidoacrylate peracid hydrolase